MITRGETGAWGESKPAMLQHNTEREQCVHHTDGYKGASGSATCNVGYGPGWSDDATGALESKQKASGHDEIAVLLLVGSM